MARSKALQDMAQMIGDARERDRRRREERGRVAGEPKRERGEPAGTKGPPPEQMHCFSLGTVTDRRPGGTTVNLGKAYRRKPVIDTLAERGVLTQSDHKALQRYRHHADMADRSPVRDSLNVSRGPSSGAGPTHAIVNAIRVSAACERAAGSLADILRAVVVYDKSLSQWAIERSGGLDDGGGVKPRQKALVIARLEFQMAAKRVRAELDA